MIWIEYFKHANALVKLNLEANKIKTVDDFAVNEAPNLKKIIFIL